MVQKKTRLQRKLMGGMKESRLDISKQFRNLSNAQVEAYARGKSKDPVTQQLKKLAQAEVARRNKILKVWKSGVSKTPTGVKGVVSEAVKGARKGVQFFGKALSGELARDIEEDIATSGLSPKQKQSYLEKRKAAERKQLAEERKEEREMRKLGFGV